MKDTKKFNYLLAKYLNDTVSFKEKADFLEMIASGDYDNIVETQFDSDIYELNGNLTKNLNIFSDKNDNSSIVVSKNKKYNYRFWFSFAASLVCIISLATFYQLSNNKSSKTFLAAFKKNNLEKIVNSTNQSFSVSLPDGSDVTLQPNSSLYYTKDQFSNKREVCMEGEAIFNIAKDSLNPFYVYYQGIVTKVLGTSFNIGIDKSSGNIEVKVLTGRVWVYENEKMFSDKNTNNGIIVTPNQKAVYKDVNRILEAKLIDNPVLIIPENVNRDKSENIKLHNFNFENSNIAAVLKSIELNYGINIKTTNENIYNCEFSGNLNNEDLYNKLKIICIATRSSYEINGTTILINGEGCE